MLAIQEIWGFLAHATVALFMITAVWEMKFTMPTGEQGKNHC